MHGPYLDMQARPVASAKTAAEGGKRRLLRPSERDYASDFGAASFNNTHSTGSAITAIVSDKPIAKRRRRGDSSMATRTLKPAMLNRRITVRFYSS